MEGGRGYDEGPLTRIFKKNVIQNDKPYRRYLLWILFKNHGPPSKFFLVKIFSTFIP
jgi:hypothetical protein